MTSHTMPLPGLRPAARRALQLAVTAALAVDAGVHLLLADNYQRAFPGGMGGGTLFRLQAAAAVLVGLWVLLRPGRLAYAGAFVVLASAAAAVVVSSVVPIPAIGPVPRLYEPVWFFEKTLSAVAEVVGAVLAAAGWLAAGRRAGRPSTRAL